MELIEPLSFAGNNMDGYGIRINGNANQTMLDMSDEEFVNNISDGTEVDDFGIPREWHSYNGESGRDYILYVYQDGSYCYYSD